MTARIVRMPDASKSERLLDLPETGELWVEFARNGWTVHHVDFYGDHAGSIASGLPSRDTAIAVALRYALGFFAAADLEVRS